MTIYHDGNDRIKNTADTPGQNDGLLFTTPAVSMTHEEAIRTLLATPAIDVVRPALQSLQQLPDYRSFTASGFIALTADDSFTRVEALRTSGSIRPEVEDKLWSLNALNPVHREDTRALQVLAERFPEAAAALAGELARSEFPHERAGALNAIKFHLPEIAAEIASTLQNDPSAAVQKEIRNLGSAGTTGVITGSNNYEIEPALKTLYAALNSEDPAKQRIAIGLLSNSGTDEFTAALPVLAAAVRNSEGANKRLALAAFGKLEQTYNNSRELTRILREQHFNAE